MTDPELESNTVMVDPVAVEKIRSFTVIWLDVIVPFAIVVALSELVAIELIVALSPNNVENCIELVSVVLFVRLSPTAVEKVRF